MSCGGAPTPDTDAGRVRRERDLYRALLELARKDEIEPFIEQALSLFVEVAGARRGYLELDDERTGGVRFSVTRECSDEEVTQIRDAFSRGVIAEALATGRTIVTASALLDPRFRDRGSVRRKRIEAVMCAPIGTDPPLGVLYVQDRAEPGPFSEEDRQRIEAVAEHIAILANRLLTMRRQKDDSDPTRGARVTLRADGVVGRSTALAALLHQVSLAAPLEISVLLVGPSGTGKTQIARVVHDNSPRAGCPFVEVNCATLTESLFESEVFGAMPGAHSTASRRVEGKVASAAGGTLFLDEVGEIPLAAQAKLLQLLQSKEYYPLGASRPLRADVRIIAATNTDLKAAVARREFREDLFYRLQVLPIRAPSLGERREDIAVLVSHFCARFCEVHHFPRIVPSVGALRAAEAAEWPGNVRELANAVQAAVVRAAGEGVLAIEQRHLFPDGGAFGTASANVPSPVEPKLTFQQATRSFQADLLKRVLEEKGWNITETAARLDLTRQHVYNMIRAFGLERPRP